MSVVVVAGAIYSADGRLLLAQRAHPPELAGLWELPGGKVEPGETLEEALVRELCEELDVRVLVTDRLAVTVCPKPGLELIAMRAQVVTGTPRAVEHLDVRWVDSKALLALESLGSIVPNDREWIPELLADLQGRE
ncbi:(deoxy)nucleoside triphosphate pyrophosphohydrolase [Gordonia sp. HY442]|uniref:(deoxy)nucleoside triphosphate pyrophosphohydrolase n=1 Tax=Gordonia zhenghanii TaxID=2911516 RepID=UPI001F367C06|nr:(deoxy)nucleoside triphosphate pyrophosphohydrolase [Gordonia zhenghanii]MCF8607824.1 (deoxy)nucleoside triphosphate pyrophosphohydrolase [Gordonia zhenghanii]